MQTPKKRIKNVKRLVYKGGPQNRPEVMMLNLGFSCLNMAGTRRRSDSLETIWRQWQPWSELLEFTIEPCADLDQTVALYC